MLCKRRFSVSLNATRSTDQRQRENYTGGCFRRQSAWKKLFSFLTLLPLTDFVCRLFATIMNHQLTGSYWLSLRLLWITSLQLKSADSLVKLRHQSARNESFFAAACSFYQLVHSHVGHHVFAISRRPEQVETGKRLSATMKCDNDELIIRRQYFVSFFGGKRNERFDVFQAKFWDEHKAETRMRIPKASTGHSERNR